MTKIEWAEAVWNPVSGCTRVSAGCDHCYAVAMTRRLAAMGQEKYQGLVEPGKGHFNGQVRCHDDALDIPLKRRKPTRWFVNSMSDLFHEDVPDAFIDNVMAIVAMCREVNGSQFLILTKRPRRAAAYFAWNGYAAAPGGPLRDRIDVAATKLNRHKLRDMNGEILAPATHRWPLPNLWIGVSAENQATYDERVPILLDIPAAVRFVSLEPLLAPVAIGDRARARTRHHMCVSVQGALRNKSFDGFTLPDGSAASRAEAKNYLQEQDSRGVKVIPLGDCDDFSAETGCRGHRLPGIDWVIVGGESGPGARPCDVEWIRSIRDQCRDADIPCFVKQLGSVSCVTEALRDHGWPEHVVFRQDVEATNVLRLRHSKGGDPDEWPADLRVREWPR